MIMKYLEIICNFCSLKCIVYRSKNQKRAKYCSDKCRLAGMRAIRAQNRFSWDRATEEQRFNHLKKCFEKRVIRKEGCWDWKTICKGEKYMRLHPGKKAKRISIHVLSWKLHMGEIPKGMNVCHKCDNTRCSNPQHLFLGTTIDNIKDKVAKQRHPRGESHGMAKLDEVKVKEIKKLIYMGVAMTRIAKDFNVNNSTIHKIKCGISWKHIN